MKDLATLILIFSASLILGSEAKVCQKACYNIGYNNTVTFACCSYTDKPGMCPSQCEFTSYQNICGNRKITCSDDRYCPFGFKCCFDYCLGTKICRPVLEPRDLDKRTTPTASSSDNISISGSTTNDNSTTDDATITSNTAFSSTSDTTISGSTTNDNSITDDATITSNTAFSSTSDTTISGSTTNDNSITDTTISTYTASESGSGTGLSSISTEKSPELGRFTSTTIYILTTEDIQSSSSNDNGNKLPSTEIPTTIEGSGSETIFTGSGDGSGSGDGFSYKPTDQYTTDDGDPLIIAKFPDQLMYMDDEDFIFT